MGDGILIKTAEETGQPILFMQPVRGSPSATNGLKPTNASMNFGAFQNHFEIGKPINNIEGSPDRLAHIISKGDLKLGRQENREFMD